LPKKSTYQALSWVAIAILKNYEKNVLRRPVYARRENGTSTFEDRIAGSMHHAQGVRFSNDAADASKLLTCIKSTDGRVHQALSVFGAPSK
jgi:cytochrome c